jgi:hypothetical protein
MNRNAINFVFILIFLIMIPSIGHSADEKSVAGSPVAFLPSNTYLFEPALEGALITHDFIIENKGSAPLQILSVQPGCGCTTASYTKEILPGASGKISLNLKTTGYGGASVNKRTIVKTNDSDNASFHLTITGNVEAFAQINPISAILQGSQGNEIKAEITITPNRKHPFKVLEVKAKGGKDISFELKEDKVAGGLQYLLTVANIRQAKGSYNDTIYLKTDSDIKPEIKISVSAEIK